MNIVISGYYGSGNGGDEAMLYAILSSLREKDPQLNIAVISGNPEKTAEKHGVKSIFWLDYFGIFKEIYHADLLISGGGSLLQNVTSGKSLYYYLSIIAIAEMLNIPVMLYAQGIGPIYGKYSKKIMKFIGNKVDVITVRDEGSIQELKSLEITKPLIECTADAALSLTVKNKKIGEEILIKANAPLDKKKIGISVREWKNWRLYKEVLAKTTDILKKDLDVEIVYIPMQSKEDVLAAREVAALSENGGIILEGNYNTEELLSIIENMDLIISIRLHALIFAAVANVPMVGLSYDPKVGRFMQSMGDAVAGHIEDLQAETLVKVVKDKWENLESIKEKNSKLLPELREKAFKNAEFAMELMNKKKK